MKYDLYKDDLLQNPRWTESSATVLSWWTRKDDPYALALPPRDALPDRLDQFAAITAERLFFREKILGSSDPDQSFRNKRILRNAHPFGKTGPSLVRLLDPAVSAVMTYVPLASLQTGGTSVLARLYCVSGLQGDYPLPFAGAGVARGRCYNWFLGGFEGKKPSGTSWHLAAEVLAFAIHERHAVVEIRTKLATKYVFTGGVGSDGRITRVERVPEKCSISQIHEYEKLEWILPKDNIGEAASVNAKSVTTLDDAYEYVLGLGPETENLIALVKDGVASSLSPIYKQLRSGADANAIAPGGRNARQMIMANIQRKIVGLIRQEGLRDRPVVEIQNEIRKVLSPEWDAEKASSYYGNDPLLFFLAAKSGDEMMLKTLRTKMDIDAADRDGETALDFAIEAGDKEVELRLRAAGARRRGIYALNSKRIRAFLRDPETEYRTDGGKFIVAALDAGLDPLAETDFGSDENGKSIERVRELWDNEADDPDPWNNSPIREYRYARTSVFREAILTKNRALVEKCLSVLNKSGRSIPEEYFNLARQHSSPMIIKALNVYREIMAGEAWKWT